jgi:hypothetical protein
MNLRLSAIYDQYRNLEMTEIEIAEQRLSMAFGNAPEENDHVTTRKSLSEVASSYGANSLNKTPLTTHD